MRRNIKTLLRENLIEINSRDLTETVDGKICRLGLILEKKIKVGDNLTKKLSNVNTNLSKKLLNFLNSDNIKDSANVEYVDYDKNDGKLLKLGYTDNRGNEKVNKFKLNKLLKYLGSDINDIKDYEVEELINHLKIGDTDNFKIYDGDDILKIYHCKNYDEGKTMGSCMRHSESQEYLKIYTNNPNQVKVLALINPENGKIRGRALLWVTDSGIFMDRVYVTNSKYNVNFNTYVEENDVSTNYNGEIELDNYGEYEYYPYMDTFQYYTPSTGTLSTTDGEIVLTDTNGGHNGIGDWSEIHNGNIPEDESVYIDHIETYVYYHEAEETPYGDFVYRYSDDVVGITAGEYAGLYDLKENVRETWDNETVSDNDNDYIELDGGMYEGKLVHIDDGYGDYHGDTYLSDELVQLTNGVHIDEYCFKDNAYLVEKGDGIKWDENDIISEDDIDKLQADGGEYSEYN